MQFTSWYFEEVNNYCAIWLSDLKDFKENNSFLCEAKRSVL